MTEPKESRGPETRTMRKLGVGMVEWGKFWSWAWGREPLRSSGDGDPAYHSLLSAHRRSSHGRGGSQSCPFMSLNYRDSIRFWMGNRLGRNIINPAQMQNLIMTIIGIIRPCPRGTQQPPRYCKRGPTRMSFQWPPPQAPIPSSRHGGRGRFSVLTLAICHCSLPWEALERS